MNTEILAARAKEGDADAFAALIWDHMQSMYKVARSILKNDADVADAIQDAILTAFEHLGRLKKPQAFHSWLVRILVNKGYDLLRRKRQVIPMETLPERPVSDAGYGNIEWEQALSCLEEKYSLILMLYYIEDFKTAEIGRILDIPETTVRTRLARGRKRLVAIYRGEEMERRSI